METSFETGVRELEDIIDSLNEKYDNTGFHYYISAILEDGAATTVVIYDNADPYAPNEPSNTGDGTATGTVVKDGLTLKVYVREEDEKTFDVLDAPSVTSTMSMMAPRLSPAASMKSLSARTSIPPRPSS